MPSPGMSVRVPIHLLAHCERLVPVLSESEEMRAVAGHVNRATVMRIALLHGLAYLERHHAKARSGR